MKRLLNGRTRIPVAHDGRTGNHPTAAANLARLARTCADQPGRRVLNAGDPDAPTARDVIEAISVACGSRVEIIGLSPQAPTRFGWTPWASWPPFFLDTTAADALGYQAAGSYAETVTGVVRDLWSLPPDQQTKLNLDPFLRGRFDYGLDEDALNYLTEC